MSNQALSPFFHENPLMTYRICEEWACAQSPGYWAYVRGMLAGFRMFTNDPDSMSDLRLLIAIAGQHQTDAIGQEVRL